MSPRQRLLTVDAYEPVTSETDPFDDILDPSFLRDVIRCKSLEQLKQLQPGESKLNVINEAPQNSSPHFSDPYLSELFKKSAIAKELAEMSPTNRGLRKAIEKSVIPIDLWCFITGMLGVTVFGSLALPITLLSMVIGGLLGGYYFWHSRQEKKKKLTELTEFVPLAETQLTALDRLTSDARDRIIQLRKILNYEEDIEAELLPFPYTRKEINKPNKVNSTLIGGGVFLAIGVSYIAGAGYLFQSLGLFAATALTSPAGLGILAGVLIFAVAAGIYFGVKHFQNSSIRNRLDDLVEAKKQAINEKKNEYNKLINEETSLLCKQAHNDIKPSITTNSLRQIINAETVEQLFALKNPWDKPQTSFTQQYLDEILQKSPISHIVSHLSPGAKALRRAINRSAIPIDTWCFITGIIGFALFDAAALPITIITLTLGLLFGGYYFRNCMQEKQQQIQTIRSIIPLLEIKLAALDQLIKQESNTIISLNVEDQNNLAHETLFATLHDVKKTTKPSLLKSSLIGSGIFLTITVSYLAGASYLFQSLGLLALTAFTGPVGLAVLALSIGLAITAGIYFGVKHYQTSKNQAALDKYVADKTAELNTKRVTYNQLLIERKNKTIRLSNNKASLFSNSPKPSPLTPSRSLSSSHLNVVNC